MHESVTKGGRAWNNIQAKEEKKGCECIRIQVMVESLEHLTS